MTGFSLLGHTLEMTQGSGLAATLWVDALPVLEDARPLIEEGFCPGATARNLAHVMEHITRGEGVSDHDMRLLADPQTSGGLLIALPPSRADNLVRRLQDQGLEQTAVIGSVTTGAAPGIQVLDEPVPLGVAGR